MVMKTTPTNPLYTQLLEGCFPDHRFHNKKSWLIIWMGFFWRGAGVFPILLVFFHLLMAELHSRLWVLFSRECPFVLLESKMPRDLELYKGDYLTSWDTGHRYSTFFFPPDLKHSPGRNQPSARRRISSLWWHQIICYCFNQPSLVSSDLLFIPAFFCFISYHIYFSFSHTFFLFPSLFYPLLSLILLYGFLLFY